MRTPRELSNQLSLLTPGKNIVLTWGRSRLCRACSTSRRTSQCPAHPCTRHTISGRPKIHQDFYTLKSFCFQWSLSTRMPSKAKSKWFNRACPKERVTTNHSAPTVTCTTYCCHPPLPQQYHKISRWANCYLLCKQNEDQFFLQVCKELFWDAFYNVGEELKKKNKKEEWLPT